MDEKLLNLEVSDKLVDAMSDEEKEKALAIKDYDEFVTYINGLAEKYKL